MSIKRKCENCSHYNCFINRYCSEEWKPLITFYKTSKEFKAGETIFSEGDKVEGIYQIYTGKIKVVGSFSDQKERIVRLATSEQLLGHRGIGGDMHYPVSAVALTDAQLTFIPIDIFFKAIKANPNLAFQIMIFFADELKASEKRMKMMELLPAKEKVAVSIMNIINVFGFDINDENLLSFTPSRKDIASLAGTTYETVIRVLGTLEKANIIKQEGKTIRIIDQKYLESLCKL